jgi:catechol 2,3-dioxygenase-like lactoylglutathione lyase family enzyme
MSVEPEIIGVYETVLYAESVEATAAFYSKLLRLSPLEQAEGLFAGFRIPDGGTLLIFDPESSAAPNRSVPSHGTAGPGHVALAVKEGSLDAFESRLHDSGVEIERNIRWNEGGRSIYFRDPAGNSVELIEGEAWPASLR